MSEHEETVDDRQARREAHLHERQARRPARVPERRQLRDRVRQEREQRRARRATRGNKENVVTCRLDDQTLDALDTLVEAGVRSTRSDAAAWLIMVGLEVNHELLDEVSGTVTEIRRLREDAIHKAKRFTGVDPASDATSTRAETEVTDET